MQLGFIVIFRGAFASLIAQETAIALSSRSVLSVDIPVGLIDSGEVASAVRKSKNIDVVLLLNANLSAIEAYGALIHDIAARRLVLGAKDAGPIAVLSLSSGVSALPIPASVVAVSCLFDLNAVEPESFEEEPRDFVGDVRRRLGETKRDASTWLVGFEKLVDAISTVDKVDRPAVLGSVKQVVVDPFFDLLQSSLPYT